MTSSLPVQLADLDQKDAQDHLRTFAQAQGVTLTDSQVALILSAHRPLLHAESVTDKAPDEPQPERHGLDFFSAVIATFAILTVTGLGLEQMFSIPHPLALAAGLFSAVGIMGPTLKHSWAYLRWLIRKERTA